MSISIILGRDDGMFDKRKLGLVDGASVIGQSVPKYVTFLDPAANLSSLIKVPLKIITIIQC